MGLFLFALIVLLVGGGVSVVLSSHRRAVAVAGPGSVLVACGMTGVLAAQVLTGAQSVTFTGNWSIPFGSLAVNIDGLCAFFLMVISLISMLAAVYGRGYLANHGTARKVGVSWLSFNLLVLGMMLVVTAANGILFIMGWEVMSIAAFFLVTFDDQKSAVRKAGYTYLIATHIGTAFLFIMFWIFAVQTGGSMDFTSFGAIGSAPLQIRNILFILALIGFGAKAGFMPLHVWLPEAHPEAPSHVSALMSGVMIKTGIYGILRVLTLLGEPNVWWGGALIVVGVVSGILGVGFALAQHDLKRMLAYCSVENIGIIAMGMGIGLTGISCGLPLLAVAGFAGALLHVMNHAVFKSLLFMGAGSVIQQTGTGEPEQLGGLFKKMPLTAITFITGAAAISGLPFLNGFVSEFLIYFSSFKALTLLSGQHTALPLVVILALAMIGGLAVACFTKAAGTVFLGAPRSTVTEHATDPGPSMLIPMLILAGICVTVGLFPFLILPVLKPGVVVISGLSESIVSGVFAQFAHIFSQALIIILGFTAALAALFLARYRLLKNRPVSWSETWGCGYAAPDSRMQYTASSFVQPIVDLGVWILGTKKHIALPKGYFPKAASLSTHTDDTFTMKLYRPLFLGIARLFGRLHWIQNGHLHLYLLYMAAVLIVMLVWFGGIR